MNKIILLLGSEGFIGRYFIEYHKSIESTAKFYMVDIMEIKKENYTKIDASDYEAINHVIQKTKPDEIYNFSGTFSNNFDIDYLNNVIVTKNIFDSILENGLHNCRILINGSAAEYGFIEDYNNPVSENAPLNPISFYGLSKVYQTYLAQTYFLRDKINVVITRPFNIIGYGISDKLFIGKLIREVKDYILDKKKIRLGNLDNERDYIDIIDLMRAYSFIMEKGNSGQVYNIGSGLSVKIKDLLNCFLDLFEIKSDSIETTKDSFKRFDIPKIVADISKLKKLDWTPSISLRESIANIKQKIESRN